MPHDGWIDVLNVDWGGTTSTGIRQALNSEIVTNPSDRQSIANILRAISNSPVAQAAIRHEMLNNKYTENMTRR